MSENETFLMISNIVTLVQSFGRKVALFEQYIKWEKKEKKDEAMISTTWSDWFLLAIAEVLIWLPVIVTSRGR